MLQLMDGAAPDESVGKNSGAFPAKQLCSEEFSDQHGEQPPEAGGSVDVSIILPVYNASRWLDECLQAVLQQDFQGTMELSVFDDASKVWELLPFGTFSFASSFSGSWGLSGSQPHHRVQLIISSCLPLNLIRLTSAGCALAACREYQRITEWQAHQELSETHNANDVCGRAAVCSPHHHL
ncbi:UDP-GlcNAc:betaGal beta-1,3-N-acetylglucosaminyltransferase-like protein 1 isoform X1 [Arapaima gigas]